MLLRLLTHCLSLEPPTLEGCCINYRNAWLLFSSMFYAERNTALQFRVHISRGSVHTANTGGNAARILSDEVHRHPRSYTAEASSGGASSSIRGPQWSLGDGTC